MSKQRDLEQKRANLAWKCVQKVKNEVFKDDLKKQKEYGSLTRSAPSDIQANGLGQTLAFWRAKSSKDGKPNPETPHYQILQHVTNWLIHQDSLRLETKDVVEWITTSENISDYRRATAETVAFLIWLKRFTEAELP
jgi:CRISPR-associated protein Cmr5